MKRFFDENIHNLFTIIFPKTIDKFTLMCYNKYRKLRKEVITMYNVIYKDLITEEIHGATMTSRQLWMFRLNSSIEVVKAEKV